MPLWIKHFALGPILARSVERAEAPSRFEQSAWQRGVSSAAASFDRGRSALQALQAVIGGAVGLPVGNAAAVDSVVLQIVIGAATGLAAYWAVPLIWSVGVAAYAPAAQRDEARAYARGLESYSGEANRLLALRSALEKHRDAWEWRAQEIRNSSADWIPRYLEEWKQASREVGAALVALLPEQASLELFDFRAVVESYLRSLDENFAMAPPPDDLRSILASNIEGTFKNFGNMVDDRRLLPDLPTRQ